MNLQCIGTNPARFVFPHDAAYLLVAKERRGMDQPTPVWTIRTGVEHRLVETLDTNGVPYLVRFDLSDGAIHERVARIVHDIASLDIEAVSLSGSFDIHTANTVGALSPTRVVFSRGLPDPGVWSEWPAAFGSRLGYIMMDFEDVAPAGVVPALKALQRFQSACPLAHILLRGVPFHDASVVVGLLTEHASKGCILYMSSPKGVTDGTLSKLEKAYKALVVVGVNNSQPTGRVDMSRRSSKRPVLTNKQQRQ